MIRIVDLKEHLPNYMQEYKEINNIMNSENPEFQLVDNESEIIFNNLYIKSCNENGIKNYEKMLNITPSINDSLEARISRVLTKWTETLPYTFKALINRLNTICGENNYSVNLTNDYKLLLVTHFEDVNQITILLEMLDTFLPANLLVILTNLLNRNIESNLYFGNYVSKTKKITIEQEEVK